MRHFPYSYNHHYDRLRGENDSDERIQQNLTFLTRPRQSPPPPPPPPVYNYQHENNNEDSALEAFAGVMVCVFLLLLLIFALSYPATSYYSSYGGNSNNIQHVMPIYPPLLHQDNYNYHHNNDYFY